MTKPRLLVVEDTPLNRDLIQQLLEDDYDLEFAFDGAQALELAQHRSFDGILLDIAIPKVDGMEVARRIRATEQGRRVPIIAVTAHAMAGDRERCLSAGCDEHVTKPIDERELDRVLRRAIVKNPP
ncbi:MAG: hypothetical protein NVS3B20_22620 [Polyangiales bacterium]